MHTAFLQDLIKAARTQVAGSYGLSGKVSPEDVVAKVKVLQELSNFLRKDPYPSDSCIAPVSAPGPSQQPTQAVPPSGLDSGGDATTIAASEAVPPAKVRNLQVL